MGVDGPGSLNPFKQLPWPLRAAPSPSAIHLQFRLRREKLPASLRGGGVRQHQRRDSVTAGFRSAEVVQSCVTRSGRWQTAHGARGAGPLPQLRCAPGGRRASASVRRVFLGDSARPVLVCPLHHTGPPCLKQVADPLSATPTAGARIRPGPRSGGLVPRQDGDCSPARTPHPRPHVWRGTRIRAPALTYR